MDNNTLILMDGLFKANEIPSGGDAPMGLIFGLTLLILISPIIIDVLIKRITSYVEKRKGQK